MSPTSFVKSRNPTCCFPEHGQSPSAEVLKSDLLHRLTPHKNCCTTQKIALNGLLFHQPSQFLPEAPHLCTKRRLADEMEMGHIMFSSSACVHTIFAETRMYYSYTYYYENWCLNILLQSFAKMPAQTYTSREKRKIFGEFYFISVSFFRRDVCAVPSLGKFCLLSTQTFEGNFRSVFCSPLRFFILL